MRIVLLLILSSLTASYGQQTPVELTPAELQVAENNLRQTLAGPREKAFLQILTEVRILRDELIDTAFVYDLAVRFDPGRYHDPRVGIYPLGFEDQFILWGKRIAVYTRSTSWKSGRFFLRDISVPREAWIFTEDARTLYPPAAGNLPPADPTAFPQWRKRIYAADPRTDIRTMSRWFRLMHDESRELLIRRLQAEKQQESTLLSP